MIGKILTSAAMVAAFAVAAPAAQAATTLTDSAVFSANNEGNNWNGWIWNTQGKPNDGPDRWNMYYSTSADPTNPSFLNHFNDSAAQIAIDLVPGVHDFVIFGESVTRSLDALQHFVLNLYFNGNQSTPGISAVAGASCLTVCAANHPNGLDIYGNSGAPEAGSLSFVDAGMQITLTRFDWNLSEIDKVWSGWSNDAPYSNGSGTPDFVGHIQLAVAPVVSAVPLPATGPLMLLGLGGLAAMRRRVAPRV